MVKPLSESGSMWEKIRSNWECGRNLEKKEHGGIGIKMKGKKSAVMKDRSVEEKQVD